MITVGNQMDITVGDYLHHLKDNYEIDTFAVYVEGFKELDGRRFLEAAHEITASGRSVILYRAGRTPAGSRATASHTASIAGDFAVTRALAEEAGVMMAETIDDFEDLIVLCCQLRDKTVTGRRLGALSNAGFECVAIADNHRGFELSRFSDETRTALDDVLRTGRLDRVVDINNPLDLTPMADEESYEAAVRAVLQDRNVDVAIVGCVPLTPALSTLERGEPHEENVESGDALPARVGGLLRETEKAGVVVIDGGSAYDTLANMFVQRRIPTFRSADRALRILDRYCSFRLS